MLKRYLFFSLILLLAFACKENDDQLQTDMESNSLSKWELVEVLYDPGDGSGVFMPVDCELILELFDDNTIWSNANLCSMNLSDPLGNFTYTYTDDQIEVDNCTIDDPAVIRNIRYEIVDDELILHFFCIEGCAHKYQKLK